VFVGLMKRRSPIWSGKTGSDESHDRRCAYSDHGKASTPGSGSEFGGLAGSRPRTPRPTRRVARVDNAFTHCDSAHRANQRRGSDLSLTRKRRSEPERKGSNTYSLETNVVSITMRTFARAVVRGHRLRRGHPSTPAVA